MRASIGVIFFCLLGAMPGVGAEPGKTPAEVLVLPTFKVSPAGFDMGVRFDLKTNRILSVRVTAVELLAYRDGLRSGDELLAVDGRPLAGLPVAELGSLFTVPESQPEKSIALSVKHRLSLKTKEITVKLRSNKSASDKPPEAAPAK